MRFCIFFGIGTLPHVKGIKKNIFLIRSWDVKLRCTNIGAALTNNLGASFTLWRNIHFIFVSDVENGDLFA